MRKNIGRVALACALLALLPALALAQTGRRVLVAAGGVAANSFIRADLQTLCRRQGVTLYLPPLKWCGDNGAMIGAQGYYEYLAGVRGDMTLNGYATMELDGVTL